MNKRLTQRLRHRLPARDDVADDAPITFHRDPTDAEIRFGHGATHYMDVPLRECVHSGTRFVKAWIVGQDGLRWMR